MTETVKNRLTWYLKNASIRVRPFEISIGVSNGYFRSLKSCPSQEVLEKIYKALPELNKVWLLTGEGFPDSSGEHSKGIANNVAEEIDVDDNALIESLREHIHMLEAQMKQKDNQIDFLQKLINNGRGNQISACVG